ncbi:ALF repeat-containing protein [Streptomyces sp. NPDC047315]|uniref:ALF repeat-containing protein n=1 Tax=Streptomyces sp. NPDC047315 TaxID=3155142 RepID=UPI0033C031FB
MIDHEVRIAILRIINDPKTGKAVHAAAQKAMNGTIADQRRFLETGRAAAQFEDDKVAVFRILADPKVEPAVKAAAERALATNTPEALRYFLERGQYEV